MSTGWSVVWLAGKCKWFGCQDSMPRLAPDTQTYPNLRLPLVLLLTLQTNKHTCVNRLSIGTDKQTHAEQVRVRVCGSYRVKWRWESEYVSKSLVFALIRLVALSCSQTAAERWGYRLCVLACFKMNCCEFVQFSTQNSKCSHFDPVIA